MDGITLAIHRQERNCAAEVLLNLIGEPRSLPTVVLERAFLAYKPKALDFIWHVSESSDLNARPHLLCVDYRTSFVDADFEDGDRLTPFGEYLKKVDGWLILETSVDEEDGVDVEFSTSEGVYWNPEWPMPHRVKLQWDSSQAPYDLSVFLAADDEKQFAHLLLHEDIERILGGMLPILEDFLNRKVAEVLQKERVEA